MAITIKQQWMICAEQFKCKPDTKRYYDTKVAFYTGAYAALSAIRLIAQIPDVSDEAGAKLLEEINAELQWFMVDELVENIMKNGKDGET